MHARSMLAVLAVILCFVGMAGCENGPFRRKPVYYCQPMQCQPVTTVQPTTQCAPVVCCPQ
jgi:hypothetical protein